MIAVLLDHLWQSSLLAAAAGLLTLVLRRNGAHVRFWLWFAASMKFLVPFSLLAGLGAVLSRHLPGLQASPLWHHASPHLLVLRPAAAPFVPHAPLVHGDGALVWLALWAIGAAALLLSRVIRGWRLSAVVRASRPLDLDVPVAVKASASLMEPGLVGVLRPVVLLPAGLLALLTGAERDAILAHELSHLRRRDNLTAAAHMLVETIFWFYPPVWLIGARLIAERERACDEKVLGAGFDPGVYARAILQVCKFCVHSPLACAAGVAGANLTRRIETIMTGTAARELDGGRKLMLAGAATLALALPVTAGLLSSPLAVQVHRQVAAVQEQAEAALAQGVAMVAQQVGVPLPASPKPLAQPMAAALAVPQVAIDASVTDAAPALEAPLLPSTPDAVQAGPARDFVLALYPSGAGAPDAVTCRTPQLLPGSRLPGPQVCQTNRVWALLRANGSDLAPDGKSIVATAEITGASASRICEAAAELGATAPTSCL